jgi:DNA-binding transcriptional ArsR family regulator
VADAAAVLTPLVPRPGTQPDFLIPIPTGPTTTADGDLAAVAATPLDVVERELRGALANPRASEDVRAGLRATLSDPAAALERVVAAQRSCWEHLVRPYWTAVDDLLVSDIAARAAELATVGLGLSTASVHLGVLRRGGLVTSRRAGREVLHRRTALGAALCG